ncbi:MAG: trans-sulfuration enzyme family protein, partial [Anaerolineae bacterium]
VLDNSWATPLYQQPLTMGVDVVVHSGTKYIAGHSDVVVGLLACNAGHYKTIKPVAELLGANLSPDDAYLVTRGLRTMPVRLARLEESGLAVARWLQTRPEVRQVLHPGLPDFPGYELGRSQMQGSSSLFAFKLHPAGEKARHAFVDALQLFLIAVSWGGFESLILPVGASFKNQPQVRQQMELDDDTFRICIGLEAVSDLIADLEGGFAARAAAINGDAPAGS